LLAEVGDLLFVVGVSLLDGVGAGGSPDLPAEQSGCLKRPDVARGRRVLDALCRRGDRRAVALFRDPFDVGYRLYLDAVLGLLED
jgi:hypothetical protein